MCVNMLIEKQNKQHCSKKKGKIPPFSVPLDNLIDSKLRIKFRDKKNLPHKPHHSHVFCNASLLSQLKNVP